jgi:hypothetical protein
LTFQPRPTWNGFSFDLFARLMGFAPEDPRMARLKGISQATWGGFAALSGEDGVGLDEAGRKKWACAILLERVDREIAGLEAHRQTLDLETIALDRSGAADVALFDPSREATLARRYEAEARRGFFKALKEFRQAEAEALERAEAAQEAEALASSCARPAPEPREPQPGAGMVPEWSRSGVEAVARGLDGRVVAVARGVGMAP